MRHISTGILTRIARTILVKISEFNHNQKVFFPVLVWKIKQRSDVQLSEWLASLFVHHSSIVLRGLRSTLNWILMMPRDASPSHSWESFISISHSNWEDVEVNVHFWKCGPIISDCVKYLTPWIYDFLKDRSKNWLSFRKKVWPQFSRQHNRR